MKHKPWRAAAAAETASGHNNLFAHNPIFIVVSVIIYISQKNNKNKCIYPAPHIYTVLTLSIVDSLYFLL